MENPRKILHYLLTNHLEYSMAILVETEVAAGDEAGESCVLLTGNDCIHKK